MKGCHVHLGVTVASTKPAPDHRLNHGSDQRSDHRSDQGSDHGLDHRTDHELDHRSDPGSDHRKKSFEGRKIKKINRL